MKITHLSQKLERSKKIEYITKLPLLKISKMGSKKLSVAQKALKTGGPSFGTWFYEDRGFQKAIVCLVAKSGISDTVILILATF